MKIFLDPGHGGHDGGASGHSSQYRSESHLVLAICQELGVRLRSAGHQVAYSRTSDEFVSLSDRSKRANDWGADYFVSIHCNSAYNVDATGIETFHHTGSSVARPLTQAIQEEMTREFKDHNDRGVKTANFSVLRRTRMPAALAEVEFISNRKMHEFVASNITRIAIALSRGILRVAPPSTLPQGSTWHTVAKWTRPDGEYQVRVRK